MKSILRTFVPESNEKDVVFHNDNLPAASVKIEDGKGYKTPDSKLWIYHNVPDETIWCDVTGVPLMATYKKDVLAHMKPGAEGLCIIQAYRFNSKMRNQMSSIINSTITVSNKDDLNAHAFNIQRGEYVGRHTIRIVTFIPYELLAKSHNVKFEKINASLNIDNLYATMVDDCAFRGMRDKSRMPDNMLNICLQFYGNEETELVISDGVAKVTPNVLKNKNTFVRVQCVDNKGCFINKSMTMTDFFRDKFIRHIDEPKESHHLTGLYADSLSHIDNRLTTINSWKKQLVSYRESLSKLTIAKFNEKIALAKLEIGEQNAIMNVFKFIKEGLN